MKTKNWAEINDDAQGTYNTISQNKFKSSLLKSSLSDYSDLHILVSGTITVPNTGLFLLIVITVLYLNLKQK